MYSLVWCTRPIVWIASCENCVGRTNTGIFSSFYIVISFTSVWMWCTTCVTRPIVLEFYRECVSQLWDRYQQNAQWHFLKHVYLYILILRHRPIVMQCCYRVSCGKRAAVAVTVAQSSLSTMQFYIYKSLHLYNCGWAWCHRVCGRLII